MEHTEAKQATVAATNTDSSGAVTKEMIDAARAEFQRLQRCAWFGHEVDANEATEEGYKIAPVEIARGVAPAMFEDIPYKWLVGLVVALKDDGALELVDSEGLEHRHAKPAAVTNLGRYADLHGTQQSGLDYSAEDSSFYGDANCTVDGVLRANYPSEGGLAAQRRKLPLVVVEVEVHNRSVPEIIQRARLYLSGLRTARAASRGVQVLRRESLNVRNWASIEGSARRGL